MSYARFGLDGSDVYVYVSDGGYLCCCACVLGDQDFTCATPVEMLRHLNVHLAAGDTVPQDCMDRLARESWQ